MRFVPAVPARIHNASSGGSGRCRIIEITNLLGPTLSGSSLKLESMAGEWLKWLRPHYIAVCSDPRNRLDLSRPTDNYRITWRIHPVITPDLCPTISVPSFKDHLHVKLQRNSFIGRQGQQATVVHDAVHGFNPIGVQIAVLGNAGGSTWNRLEQRWTKQQFRRDVTSISGQSFLQGSASSIRFMAWFWQYGIASQTMDMFNWETSGHRTAKHPT